MNDILIGDHKFCGYCDKEYTIIKQDKNYFYVTCNCNDYQEKMEKPFGVKTILKYKGETI